MAIVARPRQERVPPSLGASRGGRELRRTSTRIDRDGRGERAEAPMEKLVPKDHGEEIAVFRSQVIGPLVHRALTRGELRAALVELASRPVRLPGSDHTRCVSVPTLERWYYRFKKRGLLALVPTPRSDRGRAKV